MVVLLSFYMLYFHAKLFLVINLLLHNTHSWTIFVACTSKFWAIWYSTLLHWKVHISPLQTDRWVAMHELPSSSTTASPYCNDIKLTWLRCSVLCWVALDLDNDWYIRNIAALQALLYEDSIMDLSILHWSYAEVASCSDGICDPAPLNEALWGDYQKWERYLIEIITIFYTFDAKMITLRCSYQKLQNVELHHEQYHSKQFFRDMGCQIL